MAILPLQMTRVSNAVRMGIAQRSIARSQQALAEVQNQLATGKRLGRPSDDPGDAAIAQQVRKTLEHRQAYADTLQYASSHLSEVDSVMGDLSQLLRDAQSIASANVGSDVTADQRSAAAEIVENIFQQAVSLGNRQFQGVYLFAGDRGAAAPFTPELGGIRFVGSDRVLSNSVDESTVMPFMVNGNEVFGALSSRVQSGADLAPRLTADTRLADLRGAGGEGVRTGSILLSNGSVSVAIGLSGADTLGDVIDAINAAGVGTIAATIAADGNSLELGGVADDITVTDLGGGTTALDLGIRQSVGAGAGVPLDGQNVNPRVTALTQLGDLRGGLGIDTASGLILSNGAKTVTIDLSATTTVEGLLNAINGSGAGVLARINAAGDGIEVLNPIQGIAMTLGENGGTTAADLGIRSFHAGTPLSQLNGGRGVRTVAGDDLQITRRDGTSFTVDLDGLSVIQDVIDAINAADGGGGVTATFAASGNGLVLTDTTVGGGPLVVEPTNFSMAADDLGIRASAAGAVLTGRDVNAAETPGILGSLAELRQGLINSNQAAITRAAESLETHLDRVVRIRGQVGAQVKELESRQDRLDEQNLATQTLLSSLEDTDYNEAIIRFQTLQTALQANLQTTGQMLNLSLLDFLG